MALISMIPSQTGGGALTPTLRGLALGKMEM